MNVQHEAIFRKAMASHRPQAILEVSRAFYDIGDTTKAKILHEHAVTMTWTPRNTWRGISFGAMARGTPVKGTNGAVIPPGRYWQDIIGEPSKKAWNEWIKGKPEVHVETTEDHTDENRLFVIFNVPTTASNYGMPGVFFPTQVLGFPTVAAASVTSSADTIQRPDPMTSTEVLQQMAQSTGAVAKSFGQGLGLTPTKLALIGGVTLVTLILVSRIMTPMPKLV